MMMGISPNCRVINIPQTNYSSSINYLSQYYLMSTSIYWNVFSNSLPIMISCMFQLIIQSINMHFATNKQIMTGIGLATIMIHCLGGSILHGFGLGFTNFASRAFGAHNKYKYKQFFIQGLTNIFIAMIIFAILSVFSYRIVILTGQTQIIAEYAYKTMMLHMPGLLCYFLADFFWGYLNSQKIFNPVLYIFIFGLSVHIVLSNTISKTYGFYGIVVSTNITFISMLLATLYTACKYPQWKLSLEMFKVEERYNNYKQFAKQCFYIALPYAMSLFMFEFMALYLGSFRLDDQTAAHVALTSFEGLIQAPIYGYSIYALTRIGHYIGTNEPQKIKQLIKTTLVISLYTIYIALLISIFFREKVAAYYFTDSSLNKYFFIVMNFFLLRSVVCSLKINSSLILRALGFGKMLVKASIFCYYIVGLGAMVAFCKFLQMKILGVWFGYFLAQIVILGIFGYYAATLDFQNQVQEMYQQVKLKEKQFETPHQ